jgi:N-acetylneuraminic acid mutarotase
VNNLLTTIGGSPITNELYSLIGVGKDKRWTNEFPPMPTKRRRTIALCSEKALVVAGGDKGETLRTVEIMNTETLAWSTAADLPQELRVASVTVTAGRLYILGGVSGNWTGTHAVYTCSLTALLRSCSGSASSSGVWERIADIPVTWATCVSVQNQVLAIGGRKPDGNFSTAIHMYDPDRNFWQAVSHMSVARRQCFAAVLSTTRSLMVVGGWSATTGNRIDSVELASIIKE